MSLVSVKRVVIGVCCLNSAVAGVGAFYVGGRSLVHLAQRVWHRNDLDLAQQLNSKLVNDWTSFKTALLGLPPIVGIYLAAMYGNLGLSVGTSIADALGDAVEDEVYASFFPLQSKAPDPNAREMRNSFIREVRGEEVTLKKGGNQTLPAVFVNKHNDRDSIKPDDICVIMSHGNAMQLEHMRSFLDQIASIDHNKTSFLLYTLDGYGLNRQNGVKTSEESAKFDALAAVNYALERGYRPEQIVFFGYSIGTVGAAAAAHLAQTHCILYKGFTTGAEVAKNLCTNADKLMKEEDLQKWFSGLIPWAQRQAKDFVGTVLESRENKNASRKFTIYGFTQAMDVPINGMNNLWHVGRMHPDRQLLCIGGDQDHLMAQEWDQDNQCYAQNFAERLCEGGKNSLAVVLHGEGHVGSRIEGVREMLMHIREYNCVDRIVQLPKDVKKHMMSWLTDVGDLIALGGTKKAWREVVNEVCRMKIEQFFGADFIGSEEPITVAARLWARFRPKTMKLAEIIPVQREAPISPEMLVVLKAAEKGTVEELRQAIEALKDPSELTELKFGAGLYYISPENLLKLAVKSDDIGKLRLLIESGTPIGIGEDGMIPSYNGPLLEAATRGQAAMVKLLLENGASFGVKENGRIDSNHMPAGYIPVPLLYRMFQLIEAANTFETVCLAMRSWTGEVGSEAIREDKRLAEFAGTFCMKGGRYSLIANLLMSYGVKPFVDERDLSYWVKSIIASGNKMHLEHLIKMGLCQFDMLIYNDFTFADCAAMYGQFELENYFVEEKKVAHKMRDQALETLGRCVSSAIYNAANDMKEDFIIGAKHQFQRCTWARLLEVVAHYKLSISKLTHIDHVTDMDGEVSLLLSVCGIMQVDQNKSYRDEVLFSLGIIENLVKEGCDLDHTVGGQSPRAILTTVRTANAGNEEITQKIDSILSAAESK